MERLSSQMVVARPMCEEMRAFQPPSDRTAAFPSELCSRSGSSRYLNAECKLPPSPNSGRRRFVEVSRDDGLLRAEARRVSSSTTFVLSFVETETEPGELR